MMGPCMLRETSDQPMRELLVRSTRDRLAESQVAAGIGLTLILVPITNVLEIVNSSVVVVLPREDDRIKVPRMSIRNRMTTRIPPPKT